MLHLSEISEPIIIYCSFTRKGTFLSRNMKNNVRGQPKLLNTMLGSLWSLFHKNGMIYLGFVKIHSVREKLGSTGENGQIMD